MSTRKKIFLLFGFTLINVFLIVGFMVIRDATSINKLNKEINELTKLSVTKDRYNRKIKTTGGYAAVEESIKEYLDNYAVGVQDINDLIHDPKLTKVLSYDNYLEDGPDFKNSIAYLEESQLIFNAEIDGLLSDLEKDNIMDIIYGRTKNAYYVSLYEQFMFDGDVTDELYQSKDLFQKTKVKVNGVYDTSLDVLNFLVTYDDSWKLENGEIKFKSEDLCKYYNDLVAKVETKKNE